MSSDLGSDLGSDIDLSDVELDLDDDELDIEAEMARLEEEQRLEQLEFERLMAQREAEFEAEQAALEAEKAALQDSDSDVEVDLDEIEADVWEEIEEEKVTLEEALHARRDRKKVVQEHEAAYEQRADEPAKGDEDLAALDISLGQLQGQLGDIEAPEYEKIADHYDEEGLEKLNKQGENIVAALQTIAKPMEQGSGKAWEVVKPSYLQNLEEEDESRKAVSDHVPEYYFDIFTKANPDICKDAEYETFFGEVSLDDPSGLFVWVMDQFIPFAVDEDDLPDEEMGRLGRLNSHDCYVILHITSEDIGKAYTIFNWIGASSSVDKRGVSAIRAHELNIYLQGRAKLYTEFEGDESSIFEEYFGVVDVELDEEGTESSFRPVSDRFFQQEPRLYRVHQMGSRVACTQVERSMASLNAQDVFILDGGTDRHVFQWNGKDSPPHLRWAAIDIINRVNQYEREGKCIVKIVHQGHEEDEEAEDDGFGEDEEGAFLFIDYMDDWGSGDVAVRGAPGEDDAILYRSTDDPKAPIAKVREGAEGGALTRNLLHTGRACILDCETEIFVWLGKGCSAIKAGTLPIGAMAVQVGRRLQGIDRPQWTSLTVVHEGAEPAYFILKFPGWSDQLFTPTHDDYSLALYRRSKVAGAAIPRGIDLEDLLAPPVIPRPEMPDDAGGTVEVWAIEDGAPTFTKLPHHERGEFYSSDCYLVLYTFYNAENRMKQSYVIYWWEGRAASKRWFPAFLHGFYPVLENKIKRAGGQVPSIHRVYEQDEPAHFMELFFGQLIIYQGHRPKTEREMAIKDEGVHLLHVHRTTPIYTHAIEVQPDPTSLCSFDAFFLQTPTHLFLWYGKEMGYDDSEAVLEILQVLEASGAREVVECYEGDEDPDFWNSMGGYKEYMCNAKYAQKYSKRKPRLYALEYMCGRMEVTELPRFSQSMVLQRDRSAFMLDSFYDVFVWPEPQTSASLFQEALQLARRYVKHVAAKRLLVVGLHAFPRGSASLPIEVTRHFHTWMPPRPTFADPEVARRQAVLEEIFGMYKQRELENARAQSKDAEAREEKRRTLKRVDLSVEFRRKFPELEDAIARTRKREMREEKRFMELFTKALHIELEGQEALDAESEDSDVGSDGEEKEVEDWEYDKMERVSEAEEKKEKTAADKYMERFERNSRMAKIYGKRNK